MNLLRRMSQIITWEWISTPAVKELCRIGAGEVWKLSQKPRSYNVNPCWEDGLCSVLNSHLKADFWGDQKSVLENCGKKKTEAATVLKYSLFLKSIVKRCVCEDSKKNSLLSSKSMVVMDRFASKVFKCRLFYVYWERNIPCFNFFLCLTVIDWRFVMSFSMLPSRRGWGVFPPWSSEHLGSYLQLRCFFILLLQDVLTCRCIARTSPFLLCTTAVAYKLTRKYLSWRCIFGKKYVKCGAVFWADVCLYV